jgi:hypothetical protein
MRRVNQIGQGARVHIDVTHESYLDHTAIFADVTALTFWTGGGAA